MKTGCEGQNKQNRSIELPVLSNSTPQEAKNGRSRISRWRAGVLVTLTLLMIVHIIQWRLMGTTISPIEPSEAMYTLQNGAINAGFIFFTLAILATLIFGRFVCGWGCHIVALQDFSTWLLKKIRLEPKPFRSRLLIFVPLIVAFYMFIWPTIYRWFFKPQNEPLFPQFTNHLVTSEFWVTFPPVLVAIPFLFICGFMTVYFLGSKGFCTYACPYGGFFSVADKLAPGRIRVTDACNQRGICTATCMSNVQVHSEVKEYGMVIDPGCMKHMDCVSVCPNDALYFGYGKPSIAVSRSEAIKPKYSMSWPEDILAAVIFFISYMAVWDVYQLVPMLMALGIACVTTFLVIKSLKLLRSQDSAFYRFSLRSSGNIKLAGWLFLSFAFIWIGLNAHSGWVRYHERAGAIAFESVNIPDELALARLNAEPWLTPTDRRNIVDGVKHFNSAAKISLFVNKEAISKLAWLEYLSGDAEKAVQTLTLATEYQERENKVLSFYYRGSILNRLGRHEEAILSLDQALDLRPDLGHAREEKGEALWKIGRKEEAVTVWNEAVAGNAPLPLANIFLAGAFRSQGKVDSSIGYETQAQMFIPPDARFHWMLGLRLENIGMKDLAERQFSRALQLDPKIKLRFEFNSTGKQQKTNE